MSGRKRYGRKTDRNQADLVKVFCRLGCEVFVIEEPVDLAVYHVSSQRWYLVEVKNPDGRNDLTDGQADLWMRGMIEVIREADEVVQLVNGWNQTPRIP